MNHDQPQPEPQKQEEDDGLAETFKCSLCQNGGAPCPIHTVQRDISKEMLTTEVIPNYDSINKEIQRAANSKKSVQDFASNAEAAEYFKKLREENFPPKD